MAGKAPDSFQLLRPYDSNAKMGRMRREVGGALEELGREWVEVAKLCGIGGAIPLRLRALIKP